MLPKRATGLRHTPKRHLIIADTSLFVKYLREKFRPQNLCGRIFCQTFVLWERILLVFAHQLDGVAAGYGDHLDRLNREGVRLDGQRLIESTGGQHLDAANLRLNQALSLQVIQGDHGACLKVGADHADIDDAHLTLA